MKNWIRLCFHRNHASFSSIGFNGHKYRPGKNILQLHEKLYHKTSESFCINRLTSELAHPYQSNAEPKFDVSIADLLSSLKSHLAEVTAISTVDDITSNPGVLAVLIQCSERLPQFTTDQLIDLMDSLLIIKSKHPPTFYKQANIQSLIARLDHECFTRSSELDLQNVLPLMERFSDINRNYSRFLKDVIRHRNQTIHRKPVDILVRFVNIMNKHRYWRKGSCNSKPYEIEHYLERNFEKLDFQQIFTLICTLAQTDKSTVSFELKKKLFLYVTENCSTMDHRHLFHFLELFCEKESFTVNTMTLTPEFIRLLDTFNEKFDSFTLDCIALVGMLCTKFLVYEHHFLDKLCRRFLAEKPYRRRTIDAIVYTLTFFNYRSKVDEDVYSKMLQLINADPLKASYKHTKRYYRLISWFCNVGVYDYNIISEILDEKYLSKTCGKLNRFSVYPHPFVIDLSVEIECPDYTANRLSSKLKHDLLQCYNWDWIPFSTKKNSTSLKVCYTDQYQMTEDPEQYACRKSQELPYCDILNEISSRLNALFGEEITHVGYVLPHMPRPNLFFCLDDDKRLQNLAHLKEDFFVDWKKLDFKYKWFALTVLIRNTFLPGTVDVVPWGAEITKWRQLQKLNFNVLAVVQDEWMSMSEEQKIKLCTNLIQ